MENLKQLFSVGKRLPALILLFGIILTTSGFYNAISTTEIHTLSGNVILTYPKLHVGILMCIIGLIVAIGGYLQLHGKFTPRIRQIN
ncbi:MAG: hypothetical protein ACXV2C_03415 [Candidatus Bathyarchaeia archaeon]